ERGVSQCRALADLFTKKDPPRQLRPPPALILSSRAARADSTARIIATALGLEVVHDDCLSLDAGFRDHLDLLERLIEGARPAMIVGHNPLLTRLVDHLACADELRTGELSA